MEHKTSQVANGNYPAGQKFGTAVKSGLFSMGCMSCQQWKEDMKLLPCLHISCIDCIEKTPGHDSAHLSSSPTNKGANSLYSCPSCGYKVNLSIMGDGLETLKSIPKFITSSVEALHNGDSSDMVVSESYACSSCQSEIGLDQLVHCDECDKELCGKCKALLHDQHECSPLETFAQGKSDYIHSLITDIRKKVTKHNEGMSCVDRVKDYLLDLKTEIETEVIDRAQYLINLITKRRSTLLQELEVTVNNHIQQYNKTKDSLDRQVEQFRFISDFSESLLENGCQTDVLKLHVDVSNRCLHQLHQVPDANIDMISLKLNIPCKGKEQSSLGKLFGSVTEGSVLAGSAELVASFNVDMKWPSSIGVSHSKEVVVTGKAGAFESEGKAFFYDSRGRFHSKLDFDSKHLPLDVQPAGDGTLWLSNSHGELLNLSVAGRVLRTVPDVFQGSGHISLMNDGSLVVTSSGENKVHILSDIGDLIKSVSIPVPDDHLMNKPNKIKLNSITTNSEDDLIIGDTEGGRVIVVDVDGNLKFIYDGPEEDINECGDVTSKLKCPSAICCDPFDNILVADFTNDNVHLVSKSGQFLGYVLTKENGFSCPNCMALDHEGRLYIGQYGGDILVYHYMSCSKNA